MSASGEQSGDAVAAVSCGVIGVGGVEETEESGNPNAVGHHYGNFHNYYNFHPVSERLQHLPAGMFKAIWESDGCGKIFAMLDVGCNEGDLTIQLALLASKELPDHVTVRSLGIDLDGELINRANNKIVQLGASLPKNCNICFAACNIMETDNNSSSSKENAIRSHLHDIFVDSFSFISLFSITMWVHLQYGDEGLREFVKKSCDLTSCSILIEPQPWKCYRSAARRLRKMHLPDFPYPFTTLSLTNIDQEICDFATNQCGMAYNWSLGVESWGRSLVVYHRQKTSALRNVFVEDSIATESNS
jgi:SAM-dependent methyltransferase